MLVYSYICTLSTGKAYKCWLNESTWKENTGEFLHNMPQNEYELCQIKNLFNSNFWQLKILNTWYAPSSNSKIYILCTPKAWRYAMFKQSVSVPLLYFTILWPKKNTCIFKDQAFPKKIENKYKSSSYLSVRFVYIEQLPGCEKCKW